MDIAVDIGVNLLAALIGFGIGWAWQRFRREFKLRKARRFWKPFIDDELQVVLGRFSEFTPFEPSGFVGVGDAIALMELRAYFETLGLRNLTVSYADRLSGDSLKTNLVLLGGPDANAASKEAIERIKSTLLFGNPTQYEVALYDSATDKMYAPLRALSSGEITTDYGIIFKTTNPFAPDKWLLLVAGSFGYGTWAGIRYAISKPFIDNPVVSTGKPIECLIKADIVRDTPQNIRVVALRTLDATGENSLATET